jgi:hypothetical protein
VDKILQLAACFPDWRFSLVGPDMAELGVVPANVVAHGLMDPDAFRPILEQADVALGPLAFHRIPLMEGSPLKVGEYLAYGLPVLLGYEDTRFPLGAPFILRIPNAEDNIEASLCEIREFVLSWMGRRVERSAIAALDSSLIERRRLDFLLESIPATVASGSASLPSDAVASTS